jgi:hypothetical protein
MAYEDYKLSKEQLDAAIGWINQHWKGKQECPICGSDNWHLSEHFVTPVVITPQQGVNFGAAAYPHIIMTSAPCGYAIFINAVVAGIYKRPEDKTNG